MALSPTLGHADEIGLANSSGSSYTDGTEGYVDMGEDATQGKGSSKINIDDVSDTTYSDTSKTEVYATQSSIFSIIIPKIITLDGSTKTGDYQVAVKGNLSGSQTISVTPDDSVTLHEQNAKMDTKSDVTADISQEKTIWNQSEIAIDSYDGTGTTIGKISADGISAGSWSGILNFNIKLKNLLHVHDFSVQEVSDEYFRTAATFDEPATYYYKCNNCDEKGTEYYSYGTAVKKLTYSGEDFNIGIKSLANENSVTVRTVDTTIKDIEVTNIVPPEGIKTVGFGGTELNGVKTYDVVAYMSDSTLKLYSENEKIVMPSDSSWMFNGLQGITDLDLKKFDSSGVTNAFALFYNDSNLTNVDLSRFDTSNITNMSSMFDCCKSLKEIDLTNFNTKNVTDMSLLFVGCSSLESLDVSSFDTSNVTNMLGMFVGNVVTKEKNNLKQIKGLENFDTSRVTNMTKMFALNSNLSSLDLSSFKTSQVTTMEQMFSFCPSLKCIYVGENWNTASNNTDMFYDCGTSTLTKK